MKNTILTGAAMLCFILTVQYAYAQLEVETTNNVKVGSTMSIYADRDPYALLNLGRISNEQYNTWYGIKSNMRTASSMPTGPIVSVYGIADASSTTNGSYPLNTIVGVCGRAYMPPTSSSYFSAGVVGIGSVFGGVGVYGASHASSSYSFPTSSPGNYYAGYFAGTLKVTSTVYAAAFSTTSDSRLKQNIQNLNQSAIENLHLLRPVEYQLKPDSTQYIYKEDAKEMTVNHYGLIAQEVQELFPNIVYDDGAGYLSINYIELIPVLIKSVQELSTEVAELKAQLNTLQTKNP